jgi:hypothetical protein
MAYHFKPDFKKPKAFIGQTFCSTTAGSVLVLSNSTAYSTAPSTAVYPNASITLSCLVGDIHISTLTTAPTTDMYKMTGGDSIDLAMSDYLSLMSTSTSASFQAIVWEG